MSIFDSLFDKNPKLIIEVQIGSSINTANKISKNHTF